MLSRKISEVSKAARSAGIWLNIDDVILHIAVSRSQLYRMIQDKKFPAPYMWKGRPLWTQEDLQDWIDGLSEPSALDDKTPVTWDGIIAYLAKHAPCALTNKLIAQALNANEADVSNLTRIMTKAGVLSSFKAPFASGVSPILYKINEFSH